MCEFVAGVSGQWVVSVGMLFSECSNPIDHAESHGQSDDAPDEQPPVVCDRAVHTPADE